MKFNEDSRVKIPAILHLTRLGYTYLSLKGLAWDASSNIVPSLFFQSVSAINPTATPSEIEAALAHLDLHLDNEDLGKQFYEKITQTSGLKLIDFEDFDRNSFHVVTEFTCKNGDEEFRPDITLLINGLPLVFIEVKKPNNPEGILAEQNRNITRFKNPKFRRFINLTQFMVFSNNMEYDSASSEMIYNETLKREIPEGWMDGSLEKLGKIMGGSTPSTEVPEYFSTEGTPWITPKDLSDNVGNRFIQRGAMGVTEKGIKAASLKLLPAGTVLMSSRAPIGYLAVARNPVTTNQGFKSFVPENEFTTDYIYFTLKYFMKLIQANASGSTFKEISGGTLKAVKIHLPPDELVKKFTEFSSSLSSQQSVLERQNQELTQLRDWLLPMLMNGQVTVGTTEN